MKNMQRGILYTIIIIRGFTVPVILKSKPKMKMIKMPGIPNTRIRKCNALLKHGVRMMDSF